MHPACCRVAGGHPLLGLGGDSVADKFPTKIEGEKRVHGGVEEALENRALVDGVKGILEVNFEDGQGVSHSRWSSMMRWIVYMVSAAWRERR